MSLEPGPGARNVPSVRAGRSARPSTSWSGRSANRPRSRRPREPRCWRSIPACRVYDVRTMEDRIAASFAQTRGTMLLLLVTAALAAALAGVAIYGSIWYSVSQRLPEIGIRLALGATRASVFADVLRSAVLADVHRRGVGNGRIDRSGPADCGPALRHAGDGSGDACGRRLCGAAPRAGRRRRARPARHERRPDDRATRGVGEFGTETGGRKAWSSSRIAFRIPNS